MRPQVLPEQNAPIMRRGIEGEPSSPQPTEAGRGKASSPMERFMNAGVAQRMTCALVAIGLSVSLLIGAQADDNPPAPDASAQDEQAQQSDAPLPTAGEIQERGVPLRDRVEQRRDQALTGCGTTPLPRA